MNNIQEKFEKWADKVQSGNYNYFMIKRLADECWYFVNGDRVAPILSLRVATDEGEGLHLEYEYSVDKPEIEKLAFMIIVKDDDKMIIQESGKNLAFGIKEVPFAAKNLIIHCRTAEVHTLLFASQSVGKVNAVFTTVIPAQDAIEPCIDMLFGELKRVSSIPQKQEVMIDD